MIYYHRFLLSLTIGIASSQLYSAAAPDPLIGDPATLPAALAKTLSAADDKYTGYQPAVAFIPELQTAMQLMVAYSCRAKLDAACYANIPATAALTPLEKVRQKNPGSKLLEAGYITVADIDEALRINIDQLDKLLGADRLSSPDWITKHQPRSGFASALAMSPRAEPLFSTPAECKALRQTALTALKSEFADLLRARQTKPSNCRQR
ncbi:MAG TPA: hypothetical protein VJJ83_01290 [Candidatus Babeliales bacterium]|nr:hypothetical protein [Candidatus Babeliales bacterium]